MNDNVALADFKRGKAGHFRAEHQCNEILLRKIEEFVCALPGIKNFVGEIALASRYRRCQNSAAECGIERATNFCLVEDIQRASRPPFSLRVRKKPRSEEHTSELQSRLHLVCRLLL